MSRTRLRVSHSTKVRFCQGPTVMRPSTKGTVMKGDSSAAYDMLRYHLDSIQRMEHPSLGSIL